MPTNPDRPDEPAERETVRIDAGQDRPTVPVARETVLVDRANHETVKVPGQRKPPRSGRAPVLVAAGFAALWAALVSFVPMAAAIGIARTVEGAGGLAGAAGAGLAAWLLGHGVPVISSIGPLALAPLLLTLLAAWRLSRAGLHVTRAIGARHSGSVRDAAQVAAAVGLWYALIGALVAAIIDRPGAEVAAGRAAVHLFVLGFVAALTGSLRSTDALTVLARRMPRPLRHGIRTGLTAALFILAAGAGSAGLSVALGGGEAADMIAAYRTGVVGQAGITLVSLAYGGNAAIWAAAYLLGPGFALGADTSVRLTEVTVGPLPSLPLLSGLPSGPVGATGALLLAVPVAAAMVAGWLLTARITHGMTERARGLADRPAAGRQAPTVRINPERPPTKPQPAWSLLITASLIAGPVGGLTLGVLAWMSGGSLGAGRLTEIGPVPWQVGLVATGVIAVATVLGAVAARSLGRR